jgi:transposase-like protein
VSEAKIAVPFETSSLDPEVPEKAQRRKFRAEGKKRIFEEVERAAGHGGISAVLRSEGSYSSTLHGWRRERDAAVQKAFSQKRGPRPQRNPLAGENEKLRLDAGDYVPRGLDLFFAHDSHEGWQRTQMGD